MLLGFHCVHKKKQVSVENKGQWPKTFLEFIKKVKHLRMRLELTSTAKRWRLMSVSVCMCYQNISLFIRK